MRLIDAYALKKAILEERDKIPLEIVERYSFGVAVPHKHGESMRGGIRKALRCLEETPTVDAVQVVRCKDCRHRGDGDVCPMRHIVWSEEEGYYFVDFTMDDYYCSFGASPADWEAKPDNPLGLPPFCHSCGLKMDAKEDEP